MQSWCWGSGRAVTSSFQNARRWVVKAKTHGWHSHISPRQRWRKKRWCRLNTLNSLRQSERSTEYHIHRVCVVSPYTYEAAAPAYRRHRARTPARLFTCVKVSHSSVSYSCTKVSFPFLLHTSRYFWATSVKLESAGAHAHTHYTLQHAKPIGSVFGEREEPCIFYDAPLQ